MTTIWAFLGAIAILVVFHELGHYWVARLCGVKVLCFSVGFGKVIFKKRFAGSDTDWVLSVIPLGGYVKMLDEREGNVKPEDYPYAFNRKSVWQRMAIVVAGPLANLLLAVVLYWIVFVHGVEGFKPVMGEVPPGTPAAIAQLKQGDTIVSVNDKPIPSWQDFGWTLLDHSMSQSKVTIVSRDASGQEHTHVLDTSKLQDGELEGEFLQKIGLRLQRPPIVPVVGKVMENGAGQKAGIKEGDLILRANGQTIANWDTLVDILRANPGKKVTLDLLRGEVNMTLDAVPDSVQDNGKTIGRLGLGPHIDKSLFKDAIVEVSYSPVQAVSAAFARTWETSTVTLKILWRMVKGELSLKNISGPITIADYAGEAAKNGLAYYVGFLALISISIGVFNLLPVPILDGGHLMFYAIEAIKGSPASEQAVIVGQKIGMVMLGMLMFLALYNDINRYISSWIKIISGWI